MSDGMWAMIRSMFSRKPPARSGATAQAAASTSDQTPGGQLSLAAPTSWQADPWAATQPKLDRLMKEFADLEKQLKRAAYQDGLAEDGPMTPTLQALHLCMDTLRQLTEVAVNIPRHYLDQIIHIISLSKRTAEAQITRFQAELQTTETATIRRIADAIAKSADKALHRRGNLLEWRMLLSMIVVAIIGAATFIAGVRLGGGEERLTTQITQLGILQAAFAYGPKAADQWRKLMQLNDMEATIQACLGKFQFVKNGRHGCSMPLWIEPIPIPTAETSPPLPSGEPKTEPPQPELPKPQFRPRPSAESEGSRIIILPNRWRVTDGHFGP